MQALCKPQRGIDFAFAGEPLHQLINKVFCFAYIWSLGGNIASQYQEAFDTFCREQLAPVTAFPAAGSVYDYFVEPKEGTMVAWEEVSIIFNPGWSSLHTKASTCPTYLLPYLSGISFVEPKDGTSVAWREVVM
jgi:hypothetical protein